MTYYFEFNHSQAINSLTGSQAFKLKFAVSKIGSKINKIETWQIEFDIERKIIREIGLDENGDVIYSAPSSEVDSGFWIDINPSLSYIRSLDHKHLEVSDFNKKWNGIDSQQSY